MWPSVVAWCKSRLFLLLVEAGIVGAGVFALLEARDQPAAWGSVLILMVTAMVAGWYADETRRMAKATEEMARSSFYAACKQAGADLVILAKDVGIYAGTSGHTAEVNIVKNDGAGPAFGVVVHTDGRDEVFAAPELRPGVSEQLPVGELREGSLSVHYRDVMQEHRDRWGWNSDRHAWERRS